MATISIGASGLTELLPTAWTYSPATGQLSVRRFKGLHADAEAYADTLVGSGIEVMLEPQEGTPNSIVTLRDVSGGGGNVDANVETVWTLQPQVEQVSVFEHPKVKAQVATLDDEEKEGYAASAELANRGECKAATIRFYGGNAGRALELANLGTREYLITRATLRKGRVVSPNSAIRADWIGVNRIYTTQRLISLENVPNAIIGTLELGDWMKTAGTVEQMSDGRFSISTEWVYRETGGWDTKLLYQRG